MNKKPLNLPFLLGALFSLFIANQVFLISNMYIQISWLDIPMHFSGGFLVGFIGIYFLSLLFNTRQKMPVFFILMASLITAFAVGLIWEVVEFNSETILNLKLAETITSEDTRGDLLFDLLGALAAWLYFILLKDRTGRKSIRLLNKK